MLLWQMLVEVAMMTMMRKKMMMMMMQMLLLPYHLCGMIRIDPYRRLNSCHF